MDPLDLSYAAGIVDGEGTIGITEVKPSGKSARKRKSSVFRVYLAVVMTDPIAPTLMRELFGGTLHFYSYNPQKHRTQFRWSVGGSRAAEACEILLLFLRVKKQQAELLIRFYRENLSVVKGNARHPVPEDEVARRRILHGEMRGLNARAQRAVI